MDPIEPWIDAEAVRRMARQLMDPAREKSPIKPVDPGFGDDFEGFASDNRPTVPSAARVSTAPPVAPSPESAGASAAPSQADGHPTPFHISKPKDSAPAVSADPSVAGSSPLVARMAGFRQWLIDHINARGMFVLDGDGNPLIDDPSYEKLHFLARSLAQAHRPGDGAVGNVHVKIGSDAYLAVVPIQSDLGPVVLGAVLPLPLEASAVHAVASALRDCLRQTPG